MNLTYDEFKIDLTAEVTNLVGEEVNVTIHKVQKNNGVVLDAISVMKTDTCAVPSIYLHELYRHYENGKTLGELADKVIRLSEEAQLPSVLPDDFFMDYQKIKGRICYRLVNYEKNRQLLAEVPHKKILDLAVVFYYSVEPELLKNASILIRNIDMQRWGVSQEELETNAEFNTPLIHEWQFVTLLELMEQVLDYSDLDIELDDDVLVPMYILTNKQKSFGAACILYPGVLEQIAEQLNNHFYILPSSIHECIIMPVSGYFSQESLSKMVMEINKSQLEEVEVLSDCAYFYDCDMKEIKL